MWEIIFVALWWVLLLFPCRFSQRWSRLCYGVGMTTLLLYAGIATMGVYYDVLYPQYRVRDTKHEAISVYMGPDERYRLVGTMHDGEVVRLMKENGNWRKIKSDKLSGWIPREYLIR